MTESTGGEGVAHICSYMDCERPESGWEPKMGHHRPRCFHHPITLRIISRDYIQVHLLFPEKVPNTL